MELYSTLIKCTSLNDVFNKLILPALLDCKTDRARLKLFNIEFEKWISIPSNEIGNGSYYIKGLSVDGEIRFTKYKTGLMWSELDGDTTRSLFSRVKNSYGDRLMNGNVNNYIIKQMSCAKFDLISKYKNAKTPNKKKLYLGLIVYKHLLGMNYVYMSGGDYHRIFPIDYYCTRKDVTPNIEKDFAKWKSSGISELYKDHKDDIYFRNIARDYVGEMLGELENFGYDDAKLMRNWAEKIVPHVDYFYIYDVFNKYNKQYWAEWRKKNKTREKNLARYETVPFEIPTIN
jgi:hypothetical protein